MLKLCDLRFQALDRIIKLQPPEKFAEIFSQTWSDDKKMRVKGVIESTLNFNADRIFAQQKN